VIAPKRMLKPCAKTIVCPARSLGASSSDHSVGCAVSGARMTDFASLPRTLPRFGTDDDQDIAHHLEWIGACKGDGKTFSNFDYAGPMTETVLLGVLAMRAPGTRLEWDSENLKVKNAPEINQYTHIEYRKGWTL